MRSVVEYWNDMYRDITAPITFGGGGKPTTEVVGLASQLPKGARVIDIGCGDGRHALYLAELPAFDEEVLGFAEDLRPVNPDLAMSYSDELKVGPAWIWDRLLELRSAGLVELEALRNSGVKNPLDAEAIFQIVKDKGRVKEFVTTYLKELEDMLGVGYARIEEVDSLAGDKMVAVRVADTREKYPRCARSWKRRPDVGSDEAYPDLSARDAVVMQEIS